MTNNEYIKLFEGGNAIAEHLGVRYLHASVERSEAEIDITPLLLNGAGRVHGAVYMLLADVTSSICANALPGGALTACGSFEMLRGTDHGTLHCVAQLLHAGSRISYYTVETRDDEGELLCRSTIQMYRTKMPNYASASPVEQ